MSDLTSRTNALGVDLVDPLSDSTPSRALDVAGVVVTAVPATAVVIAAHSTNIGYVDIGE